MKKGIFIVGAIVFVYISFFTFLSFLQFDSFSYKDIDLTVATEAFDAVMQKTLFPVHYGDTAFFAGHLSLIVILLYPLYAIFPHPHTLLFLQSLFLGGGAFAVFLIAREILGCDTNALFFTSAYLIYPALNYINLFELHFAAFCVPLLLFMFFFFLRRNFILFFLFMLLSLFCREDIFLVIFGFSMYTLLISLGKKEKLIKWIITPLLSGITYLILTRYLQLLMQSNLFWNSASVSILPGIFYSWLGKNPADILLTLLTKPLYVINNILSPVKLEYAFKLFAPLAFLPLLDFPVLLIALCGMSETLLSSWPLHNNIRFQHSAMVIPFIFISAMFGFSRIKKFKFFKNNRMVSVIVLGCISIASAVFIGPWGSFPRKVPQMLKIKNSEYASIRNFFIKQIPADKPLISTFELSSHLYGRQSLCPFYIFTYDKAEIFSTEIKINNKYTYALVDFNDGLTFCPFFYNLKNGLLSRGFIFDNDWGLVETIDSLAIFQKGYPNDYKLIEKMGSLDLAERNKISSNSDIELLKFKCASAKVGDFPVLDMDFNVVKLKAGADNYLPLVQLTSDRGRIYKQALIAPFRLYPFKEWQEGEVVRIRSKLYLPDDFNRDKFEINIRFVKSQ